MEVTRGFSDDSLRKHLSKVAKYTAELRDWIGRLEDARADRVRLFEGELRVRELGQAAAEHLHLRLRLPAGFELDGDPPEVGPLPTRPYFQVFRELSGIRINDPMYPSISSIRLPGTDKPLYSIENGQARVDFDLGRVNQSDHRDVPAFRLRGAPPGEYKINWQITASGLNKPAEGAVTLKFEAPGVGEPIQTLEEAEAEREVYELP